MTFEDIMALAETLVGKDAYEIASALIKLEGAAYRRCIKGLAENLGVKS